MLYFRCLGPTDQAQNLKHSCPFPCKADVLVCREFQHKMLSTKFVASKSVLAFWASKSQATVEQLSVVVVVMVVVLTICVKCEMSSHHIV